MYSARRQEWYTSQTQALGPARHLSFDDYD
jgi:hypothetical protein